MGFLMAYLMGLMGLYNSDLVGFNWILMGFNGAQWNLINGHLMGIYIIYSGIF